MKIRDKNNRLVYIKESLKRIGGNKYGIFKCDCGKEKEISLSHVKAGNTKSCGCYLKDKLERWDGKATIALVYTRYYTRAQKFNLPFNISLDDFILLSQQSCFYCGSKPTRLAITRNKHNYTVYNGMDRVENDLGYTKDNVVPCYTTCNRGKGAMSKSSFLAWIKSVYNNSVSQGTTNGGT